MEVYPRASDGQTREQYHPPPFFLNSFSPHKAAKHIPVLILLLEECKWL